MVYKIIISIVILYIIGYGCVVLKNVWTKELDAKKTFPNPFGFIQFKKPFSQPKLSFSLQHVPTKYVVGVEVDGLTWEDDFSQYFLKIRNSKADIQDLRIDIDFLGGVVHKKIYLQEGVDDITFSSASFFNTGIGKAGQIDRPFDTYSNNLKISCSRIFQDGNFEIKVILKDQGQTKNGLFEISYRYLDENNEPKKWANRYKILRREGGTTYIDSENPFEDAVTRSLQMIPKKPLRFKKDGSIEQE